MSHKKCSSIGNSLSCVRVVEVLGSGNAKRINNLHGGVSEGLESVSCRAVSLGSIGSVGSTKRVGTNLLTKYCIHYVYIYDFQGL